MYKNNTHDCAFINVDKYNILMNIPVNTEEFGTSVVFKDGLFQLLCVFHMYCVYF